MLGKTLARDPKTQSTWEELSLQHLGMTWSVEASILQLTARRPRCEEGLLGAPWAWGCGAVKFHKGCVTAAFACALHAFRGPKISRQKCPNLRWFLQSSRITLARPAHLPHNLDKQTQIVVAAQFRRILTDRLSGDPCRA